FLHRGAGSKAAWAAALNGTRDGASGRSSQSGQRTECRVNGERCAGGCPALGLQIQISNASTSRKIDAAFANFGREGIDALFVGPDHFFNTRRVHLAVLAARLAIPATYAGRDYAEASGLMKRKRPSGYLSSDRCLCRSHPQGRQARGPAGGADVETRAGHQCPDCQNPRPRCAADAARPRRRGHRVTRRDLITLLGGAAAWPLAARAQQGERMRRIGVLVALAADDSAGQARLAAFVQSVQELGWTDGRNVRIDTRWAAGDAERF